MGFNDIQLTRDFWLREFLRSQVASRAEIDMTPSVDVIRGITRLCTQVLQPLREEVDLPFVIQSGYRSKLLNTMIGGSKNSSHLYGRAADFNAVHLPTVDLCRLIAAKIAMYPIDQLIFEFGSWCHIGIAPEEARPRRQVLTAVHRDGKIIYLTGIVENLHG